MMRCRSCNKIEEIDRHWSDAMLCGAEGCVGILTRLMFSPLKARLDRGVLRATLDVAPETTSTPISPARVVSTTECVCGQGPTFCSCTKCRTCKQVIDAGRVRGFIGKIGHSHVCPGSRELNQQERLAHSRCPVGPQGLSCVAYGTHALHYAYVTDKRVEWVNDWTQPEQIEKPSPTSKQASDLGGLLSEIVWEQRRMAR